MGSVKLELSSIDLLLSVGCGGVGVGLEGNDASSNQ